jgi:hypothetical protein
VLWIFQMVNGPGTVIKLFWKISPHILGSFERIRWRVVQYMNKGVSYLRNMTKCFVIRKKILLYIKYV